MKSYVFIETYGCSANLNNGEIMKGLLKQSGHEITNNEKLADIIIINSCIVKGKTESKIKRRIQDLARAYQNKLMIIAGCMPETDFNSLKKLNSKLLFLGINHVKDISKLIKDNQENKLTKENEKYYLSKQKEEKILLPKIPENPLISIIQISEGCLGDCSYCKTRLAKGQLYSYDMEQIIKSVQSDLQQGAKEIWITSQDCAAYGLDQEDKTQKLPELLSKILSLKHNFKLRLGMSNPNHIYPILEELIQIYGNPKMYKFLHMPIQSASDSVLKNMNRKYEIKKAEAIITKFRKEFPAVTFATDIITGYPTETNEDHKSNINFIKEFSPEVLNLSKFSSHKGTRANQLAVLEKETINKRASELMALHRKTAQESKNKFKNKIIEVFINKKTNLPFIYEARDDNYNIVLVKTKDKSILGKKIKVKITQIGVHHMIAEII